MRLRRSAIVLLSIVAPLGASACGGKTGVVFGTGTTGAGAEGGASSSSGTGNGGAFVGSSSSSGTGNGGAFVGSSSSTGATTSVASSSSSGGETYPAPFPAPPQVVSGGGPVLAHPKFYPVFFPGDTLAASLTSFTQGIGSTNYWADTTSEYGVGPATGEPAIQLTESAPGTIDDTAIQTWIGQKIAAGTFPPPDADTLYVLYYPSGTTITLQGDTSCQTFGGYHNDGMIDGKDVSYAVVPRCNSTMGGTLLDEATAAASHELIEGSTDPYPQNNPAYVQVDSEDFYWELLLSGGEVGDMCAQFPNVFVQFAGFPYVVQRTWSNAAVKAGRDPCVPELPGEVYFNAAPVMKDMATLDVEGQSVTVRTVQVPVGGTVSIPLDLYSEGPTSGPWTVQGVDPAPMLGSPQLLDLSVTPGTGVNGDVSMLSIHVLQAGPGNVELFLVESTMGSQQGVWIGLVSN